MTDHRAEDPDPQPEDGAAAPRLVICRGAMDSGPLSPRVVAFCRALEEAAAERGLPWEPWPV